MDQGLFQVVGELGRGRSETKTPQYREDGTKIRKASARMQELFPVLKRDIDPRFAKKALIIAYTSETLITIFASFIVLELFIKDPKALVGMHATRMLGVLLILILTSYNIFRGYQSPEINIRFYFVELIITFAIVVTAVIVAAIRISKKKKRGEKVTGGDIFTLVPPIIIAIFNVVMIGIQIYRFKLGKRTSPLSSLFTIALSIFLLFMSASTIYNNMKKPKNPPPE